ncbi:MAG: DNA translocase FtsK [Acidimicrobiales bacterium]
MHAGAPTQERVIPITGGAFSAPPEPAFDPDSAGEDAADDDAEGAGVIDEAAGGVGGSVVPKVWKLPPANVLGRSGAQEVDRYAVERAGRTLEHALAEHGVETRLVGMVVGPTVTRYELELGPGVKVARVTSLHRDIAYAMATPMCASSPPSPAARRSGWRCPTPTDSSSPSATSSVRRRPAGPITHSRWPSAATSPAARCWPTWPRCRMCSSPVPPAPANRAASTA